MARAGTIHPNIKRVTVELESGEKVELVRGKDYDTGFYRTAQATARLPVKELWIEYEVRLVGLRESYTSSGMG